MANCKVAGLLFTGKHFWNRKCRKKTWWQQEFARYFSDELGVPIILIDTEQMFALQRDVWYNINVNIVYYLRKKNYFRR